jgi:hypothetical protein
VPDSSEEAIMRNLGQREDGTEIGAWVLVADPDAWDLDGTGEGLEIERWAITNDECAPMMRAGDPCVVWVTPSTSSDTAGGLWAVGELAGEAFDEDRTTYVEVSVQRLSTPVPPQTFRNDPDLATVEVLDHDGPGNPLTLTPHEYAEIEDHLDELDLWPSDPETDALLDAAEDAALASLENLGWSLEDGEEGALLATKEDLQREVFVAIATEEDGFILGVEELDELLWDGDPLLLVVVEFADDDTGTGADAGAAVEADGSEAEPTASSDRPQVIKVDENWVPAEADYDRRTQLYRLQL